MSLQEPPTATSLRSRGSVDSWQRRSATIVLTCVGITLLGLFGRLAYINISLGPDLAEMARRQQQGRLVIPARRGMILDANRRVIVASRQSPDVFVDPLLVKDLDTLAAELGVRLDLPVSEIVKRIRSRPASRFVVIASRVDEATADSIRQMQHPALGLTDREIRTYPLGRSMAHVLGFVGRDGNGLEGLELAYDEHLGGQDGRRATVRDARRRALWPSEEAASLPVDGGHLVLTIDAEIQRIVEQELDLAVRTHEAESGVAIVMDPYDGAVLAMACWPGFDPNAAARQPGDIRRNRAVTDPTEPGSTFKPFIACGALAGGFVSPEELIDCRMGSYYFGRRLVSDTTPHGLLTLKGIITKSSNIGMGLIGHRMGNAALHDTVRRFGFGTLTGIDYPGECSGLVYPLDRWNSYSTSSVPMGYEVAVTPLQLITALCAIVNDGVYVKPRLVSELLAPDGTVMRSLDSPEVVRRVVSSEVARYVARDLLVSVVEEGTGHPAKTGEYRVLGKTGTAKLPYTDRAGYEPGAYLGTFIGAAPADDPAVVAVVMIRRPNPELGYYGSRVAAPAVGRILTATLAYFGVEGEPRVANGDPPTHTGATGM